MFKKILFVLALLGAYQVEAQSSIIRQDNLKMGRGTGSDKSIVFDKGSGAANPAIKWNNSSSQLQFSNDGSNYLGFGSGSGSGGAGYSVLTNGNFETGIDNAWTYSGATVTAATSGSNLLFDTKSAVFDATANAEFIQTSLYTIPNGLYNRTCYVEVTAKGGDANLTLEVRDGSAVLIASRVMTTFTNPTKWGINFSCPSSGQMRLKIVASADAAAVAIDQAYLGEAPNTAQVSQAEVLLKAGRATTDQTISTTAATTLIWNSASVDSYAGLNTSTGVYTIKKAQRIYVSAAIFLQSYTAAESNSIQILHNGSALCRTNSIATSGAESDSRIVGCIINAVVGDTIAVQTSSAADSSYTFDGDSDPIRSQLNILGFPTASQTAYSMDTIGWKVDANISGANPSLGFASISSYTGIENSSLSLVNNAGSGNLTAQIPCSSTNAPTGTTCSVGNESVGVSFTVPAAGDVLACANFTYFADVGTVANTFLAPSFQVVETPINAQTISQEGKSRTQALVKNPTTATNNYTSSFPLRICGTFTFASAGQKVLRLMYEQSVSGTANTSAVLADQSAADGQRDVHWEVYPLNQQVPAPILYGGSPTVTRLSSGSGTYTLPSGVKYIRVRAVGGGGGGSSSGTAARNSGGAGGTTTFGTSLITCNGGGGGGASGSDGGTGNSCAINSPAIYTMANTSGGGNGGGLMGTAGNYATAGIGGASPFGGAGGGGTATANGNAGATNSGSGGGGGGGCATASCYSGGGGGAGGYGEAFIPTPSSSYTYSVGASGAQAAAGTNGFIGGAGGSGYIIVEEYYQ